MQVDDFQNDTEDFEDVVIEKLEDITEDVVKITGMLQNLMQLCYRLDSVLNSHIVKKDKVQ